MTSPIVEEVRVGDFGPFCAKCYGAIYADRAIFRGKVTQIRYRHVEKNPACLDVNNPLDMTKMRA